MQCNAIWNIVPSIPHVVIQLICQQQPVAVIVIVAVIDAFPVAAPYSEAMAMAMAMAVMAL